MKNNFIWHNMYDFISTKLCTYVVGNSTYTYFFPEIDIFWSHKFRKILNLHSRLSSGVVCIALWEEYSLADMRGFSHWRHFLEDFLLRSLAVRIEVPETEVEGSADNLTKVPRKKAMKNLRQSQHTCLFCKKGENFLLKLLASQAKLGSMLRFFFCEFSTSLCGTP